MKKNITLLFIFVLVVTQFFCLNNSLFAVPAYPYPISYTQADGSKITIKLKGDEKVKWAETMDGYSIVHNQKGTYEYAVLDANDDLIASGIQVKEINQRSRDDNSFLNTISKGLHYSVSQVQQMKSLWKTESSTLQKSFPTTGTRKLLVILANFSNTSTTYSQTNFNNYMNQANYNGTGSFKDYYIEVSYGQLTVVTTVTTWVTLPNTHDYYGPDTYWGQFALDAITAANNQTSIDFSTFDNDLDGIVEGVAIFHQGQGQEESGSTLDIWSHSWDLTSAGYTSAQRTFDGVKVNSYTTMPEINSTGMGTIGVMCHEFGHNLGSPDFYDIDYSTGGQYDGTGDWDLMASGSWNGTSGNKPAHPNAYIKTMVYNWATPTLLTSGNIITLNNAEQNSNSFYRYNTTTTNEYYLIENRQQQLFDTYIPGHGMIIYHVDGNYISTASGINAGIHQGMYPVCAGATGNPTSTYGTINGTTCPFPGTGLKTLFTDTSTPWSKSWAGGNTSKPITSISENTTNKTISFSFMGGSSCTPPATQATGFTTSNLASASMTIGWTRGSGNNVIVVAKATSAIDADPVSGTVYTANAVFGSGAQIGTGNYIVYNGSGTSVNITGLTTGVTYYFAVYEYATTASCYLLPDLSGYATAPCGTITTFPYTENFNAATIPTCYSQQNTGTGLTNLWAVSATNTAGGTANELKATYQNINPGTSRLILTPINTINKSRLDLSFKHFFDDYGVGATYKIQTSNDLVNWTDVGWTYASGMGNVGPVSVTVPITQNLNNATTYIAFVLDGNLYYFDYWYIDEINITATQTLITTLNVSATTLPSFGNVNQNYSSSKQYIGISGNGLTGNINITAPTGFSVSTNCNSTFSSAVSLTPTSGNVNYTRVWVKYNPAVLGTSVGNITVATTGVNSKTVAVSGSCISGAIPSNYYSTATATGALLKTQLHNIIKGHIQRSYANLWTDFQTTDKKYNGKVWDMYGDKPCDSGYEFTFINNQCGSYTTEGNCYDREHSMPNSWWNGTTDTMFTDLNILVPTDGYVNNMRSNYTFGNVASPNWISINGSKKGACTYPGYTGNQTNVFEPIDEYKGDFARIFLYMATRYENRVSTWPGYDVNAADCFNGTAFPAFQPWQINLLMEWNNNDPVSQKEINRNNAVYSLQGNRNPFIDHPEYVALIWQSTPLVNTSPATNVLSTSVTCNGTILSQGSSSLTESGIVYSILPNPLIGGVGVIKVATSPLVSSGNFSVNLTSLIPQITYYARAFATNTIGTTYGNDVMFTTDAALPQITTDSVRDISTTTAKIYCNIVSNIYSPMQFTGVVYSTSTNPFSGDPNVITASSNPMDTTGIYFLNLINLIPGTTYYLKAIAINGMGVSYGNEILFTTNSCITQSIPYTQNFETTFPPSGWSIYNPDGSKTWQNKLTAGKSTGNDSSAYINFYSYNASGQIDDLISPVFDLTTATNPKLIFNVAYKYYSVTSVDTLKVFVSTDCGNTYQTIPIYTKGGAELSTGGIITAQFTPTVSSDWRQEVINLSPYIGNGIRIKFQAVNDYGNNLYIDDIQISPDGFMTPTTYTYSATVLNQDTVILYGRVNANGLPTSVQFDYGNSISYTNSLTAYPNTISGDSNINVYQYIIGLPTSSTFHYRVSATNTKGTSYGNDVVFNTPCTVFDLPIIENFDNPIRPNCWTTQNISGLTDKWTISATNNAGGSANELKLTYQSAVGTVRFVSPAINTIGKNQLKLTFKQFYDDYSTGAKLKIQTSTDAINWTDENYSFSSGNGNFGPIETIVTINNNINSPTTFIAFVATDSLLHFDYWYIDNIKIEEFIPQPDFSSNKINTCLNDSITFYNLSQGIITSYLWNFGDGAFPQTASGIGPFTVKYNTSGYKTISLTVNDIYTVTKNSYINIADNPYGGTISGNGNICLGSNTGTMVLTNYIGIITKWQKRNNSGSWVDIPTTNSSYTDTPTESGNWEYRIEVSNAGCNSVFSEIYAIVVFQNPIAGITTSIPSSICSGGTSTLIIDNYVGNIQWQQSGDGSGSWIDVAGGNGANSQNYITQNLNTTTYYKAVVSNGNCSLASSSVASVIVLPSPVSGTATCNNTSLCTGNSTSLILTGNSGSIQWEQSNDSIIWNNVSGGSGPNNAIYTTPTLLQTTYYRAKLTINTCSVYSNSIKITVSPFGFGGTISVAGSPMCGGNTATLTLNNSVGSIQWIQSATGAGNWINVTSGIGNNTAVYTTSALSATTYFRAKLSSGNCAVVYSPISNVVVYPQVIGGVVTANTDVCSGNSTTINLSGSSGNILWQQTTDTNTTWINTSDGSGNNTASFTTPTLTVPIFYRAKLSGTFCPDAYSNIISIKINTNSIGGEVINILPVVCEGSTATLSLDGNNGNIQWQQSPNGVDNWNDIFSGTGYDSLTYISDPLIYTTYYRAKVTNGGCPAVFSSVAGITVDLMPVAGNINPLNQSVCNGNTASVTLLNSFGNIQWQQSNDGANNWMNVTGGSNPNVETYTSGNLISKIFYKAVLSNGVCPILNSNIAEVSVSPLPIGGTATVGNNNFCNGGSSSVILSGYVGSIQWEQSSDSLLWNNVNGGNGSTSNNYTTSSLSQSTYFRAKLTLGSCMAYSNSIKVNVYPTAVGGNISVSGSPICAGSSTTLTLNNSVGSIQWIQSATGGGNWNNVTTGSGFNSAVFTTSDISTTTYYRAKLSSGNCPVVYSSISNVVVNLQPVGGTAVASVTDICTGTNTSISLSGQTGSILWEQSNDNLIWSVVSGGSGITSVIYTTPVLNAKRYYRAKLSSGICPVSYSNVITINISTPSNSGTITLTEDSLCQGMSADLTLSNNNGYIQWQKSINGISNWTDIVSGNGFNSNNFTSESLSVSQYFRVKVTNGSCNSVFSNSRFVQIDEAPTAGVISTSEDTICYSTLASLSIVNVTGNIQWQSSLNGNSNWTDLANGNNNAYSQVLTNSTYFRAKITNGVCSDVFSNTDIVNIQHQGIAGEVTGSKSVCFGSSTGMLTLRNAEGNITKWQKSLNMGLWIDIAQKDTIYSEIPDSSGDWLYRAVIENYPCSPIYAEAAHIQVSDMPVGGIVSGSKDICFGNSTQSLNLQSQSGNVVKWQKQFNNQNWIDIANTDTLYSEIPDSLGEWKYRAIIEKLACNSVASTEAIINVIEPSKGGVLSGSKQICFGNSTDTLLLTNYTSIINKWQKSLNDGEWIDINFTGEKYVEIPNIIGNWKFRALTYNGVCDTTYSTIATIIVNPLPLVNAGNDQTIYANDYITLNASGGVDYQWNNNVLQGIAFKPDSSAEFIVIATDTNGCYSSDTVSVRVKVKMLQTKLFLEGFYAGNQQMRSSMNSSTNTQWGNQIADKIIIELHDSSLTYQIVYSDSNIMLNTNGIAELSKLSGSLVGNYYIVIKNRNHIETWSALPVSFAGDSITYDFTDAANKAFGDNQKQIATGVYAIIPGDTDGNGFIDSDDMNDVDNNLYISGYINADTDGNGFVDSDDMNVVDNNLYNGVIAP